MRPVTANDLDLPVAAHEHLCHSNNLSCVRVRRIFHRGPHHLGDAVFGGVDVRPVRCRARIARVANIGRCRVSVPRFDFRGLTAFIADKLDLNMSGRPGRHV